MGTLNRVIISHVLRILNLQTGLNHCMMKHLILIDTLISNPFSPSEMNNFLWWLQDIVKVRNIFKYTYLITNCFFFIFNTLIITLTQTHITWASNKLLLNIKKSNIHIYLFYGSGRYFSFKYCTYNWWIEQKFWISNFHLPVDTKHKLFEACCRKGGHMNPTKR